MSFPFVIGLHCHQPVNNFNQVVDEANFLSYKPFLEAAAANEKFKFVVHYSGWLLEYLIKNHKETYDLLKKLSDNGQIEFFTGGYYEPILSAIPSVDRRGQVEKLSKTVWNYFGQSPTGAWLTERVWDPAIIPDLYECGVEDLIVDDYHFIAAGFHKNSLNGYFRTEQDGVPMNIFPIDKGLRYMVPFSPVLDVVNYIKKRRDSGSRMLILFDDGEKFGLWPKTYEWVYEKGWLEEFIDVICDDVELEAVHFEDLRKHYPIGFAYLPITSYPEMGEWSLFTDAQRNLKALEKSVDQIGFSDQKESFVRGGIWKNFFVKYPESNRIHKRTLNLSAKNKEFKNKNLEDLLYQSQCNDCLWHGVFGGLYLPNLRDNAWNAIIEAEKVYEKLSKTSYPDISYGDLDFDGYKEAYYKSKLYNAQFFARDGGQMTTLEFKNPVFNFLNTLSRRPEIYHDVFFEKDKGSEEKPNSEHSDNKIETIHDRKLEVSEELKKYLGYDWYNRNCFIDHMLGSYSLDDFIKGSFHEKGSFVNTPLSISKGNKGINFKGKGTFVKNHNLIPATLNKEYTFTDENIICHTNIKTDSHFIYVQEHNLHFADYNNLLIDGSNFTGTYSNKASEITIRDLYTGVVIKWIMDKEFHIDIFEVCTVSQSVESMELTKQGICVLFSHNANNQFECKVILDIQKAG